jgi:arylsulfatase A-like enzyme
LFGLSADDRAVEALVSVNRKPVGKVVFAAAGSEATLDLAPEVLSPSGENVMTLHFERDISVPALVRRTRQVFRPRNLGLAYVTFGDPNLTAPELIRRERRAVREVRGALRARAGSKLITFWQLRKGSRLELTVRNPPQTPAAALWAHVRLWCKDQATEWQRQLAPGTATRAELQLDVCSAQPSALSLEVAPAGGPDLAAELEWGSARVIAPPALPRAESPPLPLLPKGAPVLLIVLDAAAAKHFHSYGYDRPTTPNLDRLAEQGTLFERAYTAAAYTLASVGTIMTGNYPDAHGVVNPSFKLPAPALTLAEALDQAGYQTGSLIGNHHAGGTFGYDQGFEVQQVWRIRPQQAGNRMPNQYDDYAANLVPAIERFVTRQRERPFFLYVHFREPHSPYWPPAPYDQLFSTAYRGELNQGQLNGERREMVALERGLLVEPGVLEHLMALYDGNLAYVDAQVGRALEILRRLGLYDKSCIIVTADHGESFLEHGHMRHSVTVYEENVHIPLIIKFPAAMPRGRARVRELASLVDLLPTLLGGLGLPLPATTQGLDLRTLVFHPGVSPRRSVLALTVPQQDGAALIGERYKLISMPLERRAELYDLLRDPKEKDDLAARLPLRAGLMLQELRAMRARCRTLRSWTPGSAVIDPETREALRALGYANG